MQDAHNVTSWARARNAGRAIPVCALLAKTKVEKSDIEGMVGEFRKLLENAVGVAGTGQSTILEIK
jgi:hypothetical protein